MSYDNSKYTESTFINGSNTFQDARSSNNLHRPLIGLPTPIIFQTGSVNADQTYRFPIPVAIIPQTLWARYPANPSGKIKMEVLDINLTVVWEADVNVSLGSIDNVFVWDFGYFAVKKDYWGQFTPTQQVTNITVFATPCIVLHEIAGIAIN